MNEPADSKGSMERAMVEANGLLALGVAPAVLSGFKVRGHDRVTLGHDVGAERNGQRGGTSLVCVPAYGWGGAEKGVRDHG